MPNRFKAACLAPLLIAAMGLAPGANAATNPSQVRVAISPGATDPVWKTLGVKFEKAVECKVVKATSLNPGFPAAADVISTGAAKAPLFNPGLPKPDGTYTATPNNGDNTIFVPLDLAVDPKSYVACGGRILANGINVTAGTRAGLTYATIMQMGGTGPIGVTMALDPTRLAAIPQVLRQGTVTLRYKYGLSGVSPDILDWSDLDTGAEVSGTFKTTPPPGADLHVAKPDSANDKSAYVPVTGSAKFFSKGIAWPANGLAGISYDSCKNPEPASQTSGMIYKGSYYCIRTSEGRIGAIAFDSEYVGGSSGDNPTYSATFYYIVWK